MGKLDVINFFKEKNFKVDILELEDCSTVVKAAETLKVNTNDIAKTLAFRVNDEIIVIVASGDARIDNHKFRQQFNVKASMLKFDEVEALIGHPVGGVCPFGLKEGVTIYLDKSLKNLEYIYPAAGGTNSVLKIKTTDMERLTNGTWVDVCTIKEESNL